MSNLTLGTLIFLGVIFICAVIYISLRNKLTYVVSGTVYHHLLTALKTIDETVNNESNTKIDGMKKLSSAKLDRLIEDRNKPLHQIESFPEELRPLLVPLTYEKVTELLLASVKGEIDADVLRVITVMAARKNAPIPFKLVILDDRTLDFYQMLNFEQHLVSVSKADIYFTTGDRNEIDTRIDIRYCAAFFNDIATICTRSQMQNNFPNLDTLHVNLARDRKQALYGRLSSDVTGSMATIYSALTGMKIPQTYVRYGQLTHELMKLIDVKSRPTLRVINSNKVEKDDIPEK